ncbi:MAG: TonB-dependent receptor [Terracidiphilus sp.]
MQFDGEFQHYIANGEINVFGSGTVILTSDFGFADLNGDGQINDLDIPIAVGLKSSAPVVPVPIPIIYNSYAAGYVQDDWRIHPRLTLNLGLRWEYDTNLTGTSSAHDPCPDPAVEPTRPCTWMANRLGQRCRARFISSSVPTTRSISMVRRTACKRR